jgi:hypothetical protein
VSVVSSANVTVDALTLVREAPDPENVVALNVPLEELNVKLVPLLTARLPVADVE